MFHYKFKVLTLLIGLILLISLSGCATQGALDIYSVSYQSINASTAYSQSSQVPDDARIMATYAIDQNGKLMVIVKNLTDQILIIDQEMSFMINTDGNSVSYYDPTVRTTSVSEYNSGTQGASFNLGGLANAFGVGGPLGSLLGATTVGGSSTAGSAVNNTTYFADQKRVMIGPRGKGIMSKQFSIDRVGKQYFKRPIPELASLNYLDKSYSESPIRFKVCISFSLDDGQTFDKMITDFYVSSQQIVNVVEGKTNAAFRTIMESKPNALAEPWYMFSINNNMKDDTGDNFFVLMQDVSDSKFETIVQGVLFDFK